MSCSRRRHQSSNTHTPDNCTLKLTINRFETQTVGNNTSLPWPCKGKPRLMVVTAKTCLQHPDPPGQPFFQTLIPNLPLNLKSTDLQHPSLFVTRPESLGMLGLSLRLEPVGPLDDTQWERRESFGLPRQDREQRPRQRRVFPLEGG